MPQQEEHLRDYLQLIRKHDFTICLSVLLVLGIALIVSLRLPKTYAASTLILLAQPSTTPSFSSTNLFQNVFSGGVDRREMETISTRFSTESMLNTAIENLEDSGHTDAVALFPSVGKLKQLLNAQVDPDSDYINISINLTEEEGGERNAALLVNQLAKDMQILRRGDEETELKKRMEFLEDEQQEIEARIQKELQELLKFVRENGSPETWAPLLTNLLERTTNVREKLETNRQELHATRANIAYLQAQLNRLPQQTQLSETTAHNPVWLFQQEKLFNLESQRVADAKKVGKNASELEGLNAQIAEIHKKNKDTPQTTITTTHGTSSHYTYIQNQLTTFVPTLASYEDAEERLKQEYEELKTELAKALKEIPENHTILTQIRAKIQTMNGLIEEIVKRSLEVKILYAESKMPTRRNQVGGIEIVDRAAPRKIPVSPQIKLILVIASIAGLVLGVTTALFTQYFNKAAEK